jgi:hypothetical protein
MRKRRRARHHGERGVVAALLTQGTYEPSHALEFGVETRGAARFTHTLAKFRFGFRPISKTTRREGRCAECPRQSKIEPVTLNRSQENVGDFSGLGIPSAR